MFSRDDRVSAAIVLISVAILIGILVFHMIAPKVGASSVGDVNCDQVVEAVDATILLQTHAGMREAGFCYYWNADIDNDGDQDSRDALILLQRIGGLGELRDCANLGSHFDRSPCVS